MAGVRAVGLRRLLLPRRAAVSAGSARCTTAPTARSSSTRNRQPVVASSATSSCSPANRSRNRRTPTRSAGLTRARLISPLARSIHSAVICARCWSTPITIDIQQTSSTTQGQPPTSDPSNTLVGGRCLLLNGRPRGCNPRAPTYAVRHEGPGHLPAAGATRRPGNARDMTSFGHRHFASRSSDARRGVGPSLRSAHWSS